jgi:hypothetical protein
LSELQGILLFLGGLLNPTAFSSRQSRGFKRLKMQTQKEETALNPLFAIGCDSICRTSFVT